MSDKVDKKSFTPEKDDNIRGRVLPPWMSGSVSKDYPAKNLCVNSGQKSLKGVEKNGSSEPVNSSSNRSSDEASTDLKEIAEPEKNDIDSFKKVTEKVGKESKLIESDDVLEADSSSVCFGSHEGSKDKDSINETYRASPGEIVDKLFGIDRSVKNEASPSGSGKVHCASMDSSDCGEQLEQTAASQSATMGSTNSGKQSEQKTKLPRDPCIFGAKCFRKNKDHFDTKSHPGDEDFVDSRPECEFGIFCYRKNLLHQKWYKHTGGIIGKRRKQELKKNDDGDNYSESDESDFSVSDSDGYEPSGSSSSELDVDEDKSEDDNDGMQKKRKLVMKRQK